MRRGEIDAMRTNRPVDAAVVKRLAAGRWVEILRDLAPDLETALNKPGLHVPCPVHGGKDGFRLFRDVAVTGGGVCNTCGSKTDGLAVLQWVNRWSFPETVAAVAAAVGADGRAPTPRGNYASPRPLPGPDPAERARDQRRALHALQGVWDRSVPLTTSAGAPARLYLQRRGIDLLPDPSRVRCHPCLGYYEKVNGKSVRVATYPALIARFTDGKDALVTLQRTYLTPDGAKAGVKEPKKTMRPAAEMAGGCVRLSPAGWEVGIAEGLETALAVQQRAEMPVWATLSATLMETWTPPEGVRLVIVWADNDRKGRGQGAAETLRQRMEARGVAAQVNIPRGPIPAGRKSVDWADALGPRYIQA
jgi:putative DNA primase/helicase